MARVRIAMAAWLVEEAGALLVEEAGERRSVTARMIEAVFARYGRPLAVAVDQGEWGEAIEVVLSTGGRGRVRAFSHRTAVDVIANDYLILEREGEETVAGAARLLGAAMLALSRAGG